MFLKHRKASTDPRLRSLLQKAARRGYVELVKLVARRLYEVGDRTWLRSRAAVITFEECWPLADRLVLERGEESKAKALADVAKAQKHKDAAGLGALAYAHHEGDRSVAETVQDLLSVKIVSEALDRPPEFFAWAKSQVNRDRNAAIVENARRYLAAATWGWDKTCILAGAYLATRSDVPSASTLGPETAHPTFPYWVALDKHTPEGKEALRRVCTKIGASYRQVIWAGFYFESAVTDSLAPSPWWETEKGWRLRKAGLTEESAAKLWASVRVELINELAPVTAQLESLVRSGSNAQAELLG
jgi:hypothetical protein